MKVWTRGIHYQSVSVWRRNYRGEKGLKEKVNLNHRNEEKRRGEEEKSAWEKGKKERATQITGIEHYNAVKTDI